MFLVVSLSGEVGINEASNLLEAAALRQYVISIPNSAIAASHLENKMSNQSYLTHGWPTGPSGGAH